MSPASNNPNRSIRSRARWLVSVGLLPLIIVGALLGVVAEGDTALERIPVALVNNDELITEINEAGEEEFIFASRPLVSELVGNEDLQLEWVITNSEQAELMLENGDVYAVFEIPTNFSQAVSSLSSDTPEQATFSIRTNPSRSYLAGILADQLGVSIVATLNQEFGREVTKGLFAVIVDLGDALVQTSEAATDIAEGTDSLAEGTQELATGVGELATGTTDLASGYRTFDDGLQDYLGGVRSLSDGAQIFERETRGLPELAGGIAFYTQNVSGVVEGLNQLDQDEGFSAAVNESPETLEKWQTLLGTMDGLAGGGNALSDQAGAALDGVRKGIVGLDGGAQALGEASADLQSGSSEIRDGIEALASGVGDVNTGVSDLNDGVQELADGVREFSDALAEGSAEISEQNLSEPSQETLDTIVQPVSFDQQDRTAEMGLLGTIASVFVPIGLWFVALVFFVTRAPLSHAMLSGTARTRTLLGHSLKPVAGALAGHVIVATALTHLLGGVGWGYLVWTLPLITLGASTFMALHYVVWVWRSRWLGPVSVLGGLLQVITLGSLLPQEILPLIYQSMTGFTPMSWFIDSLQVAIAGAGFGRIAPSVLALLLLTTLCLVATGLALRKSRLTAQLSRLGLGSNPERVSLGHNGSF